MTERIYVFGSWFSFAIILYLILACIFGFVWAFRVPSKQRKIDYFLIGINSFFMLIGLITAVLTIIMHVMHSKEFITKTSSAIVKDYYIILFSVGLVIMLAWIMFMIMFSNNFLIIFTNDKLYLFGLSILNYSIIKIKAKSNKYSFCLEYVFKKDGTKIYTEKIWFWKFAVTTKFLLKNYAMYFEPSRNQAFFDINKVMIDPNDPKVKKTPTSTSSKSTVSTTVIKTTPVEKPKPPKVSTVGKKTPTKSPNAK